MGGQNPKSHGFGLNAPVYKSGRGGGTGDSSISETSMKFVSFLLTNRL